MTRINTEAPDAREMDIETIVNAIDPPGGPLVVYPATRPGMREFTESDPYDWIEPEGS